SGVARFATQRIIPALAVRATDRMDGSEVKHIEASRGDLGQSIEAIVEGTVLTGNRGLAPRHHLVPSTGARNGPVDEQWKIGAAAKVGLPARPPCRRQRLGAQRRRL